MTERELVQIGIAAGSAESARGAALGLFCAAGRRLLPSFARSTARLALERASSLIPAFRGAILPGPARAAGSSVGAILGAATGGAALGGLLDGSVAAVRAHREGLAGRVAVAAVVREIGAGAVATGVGALSASTALVLLGPVAPGAVLLVAFAGSTATRVVLSRESP